MTASTISMTEDKKDVVLLSEYIKGYDNRKEACLNREIFFFIIIITAAFITVIFYALIHKICATFLLIASFLLSDILFTFVKTILHYIAEVDNENSETIIISTHFYSKDFLGTIFLGVLMKNGTVASFSDVCGSEDQGSHPHRTAATV